MELNEKEKKILNKMGKAYSKKKIWKIGMIIFLFLTVIYLIIFIKAKENECFFMAILFFSFALYLLEKIKILNLLNKLNILNKNKEK